jgi:hypothetical protein
LTVRFNNNNNITTTIVVIVIALTINLPFSYADQILPNLSLPLFTSERAFDIASYSHAINGIPIVI